jgi:hypothetical protein
MMQRVDPDVLDIQPLGDLHGISKRLDKGL